MSSSNSCNCSSQTTIFLWNVLETSDHLVEIGIVIFFDRRCDEDFSIAAVTSLVPCSFLDPLQWIFADFLELFLCILAKADLGLELGLYNCMISSLERRFLELREAVLHSVAEIKRYK